MLLLEVFQSNYLYVSKWLSNLPDTHTLQFEGRNNFFFFSLYFFRILKIVEAWRFAQFGTISTI